MTTEHPSPTPSAHPDATPIERHTLLSGEVVEFERPSSDVMRYLARVQDAARDPNVSEGELVALIYSADNPLLDPHVIPGRGVVTQAVFNNPIYHVMSDLLDHKRVQLGTLDLEAANAMYTVTVSEAAVQLGISPDAVRKAIYTKRLSAHKNGGTWYLHPNSVNAYRVSNRGPKPHTPPISTAGDRASGEALEVRRGSTQGVSFLIKAPTRLSDAQREGNALMGTLSPGWVSVGVITNDKASRKRRFYRLEPADSPNVLEHFEFYVRGKFKIAETIAASHLAQSNWQAFDPA